MMRPRGGVVAGPAKALALADAKLGGLVEPEAVADVAARGEVAWPAVGVREPDAVLAHLGHRAGIARADAVVVEVAVEERNVPFAPVARIASLRPGEAEGHQGCELDCASIQRPIGFESFAHRVVDVRAQRPGGREQRGFGPRFAREAQPQRGRGLPERLGRHLVQIGAESVERIGRRALNHVEHRGLQVRVALAAHLVEHRRRHPCVLELSEGLARLHAPELAAVADEHQARDAQLVGDAQQRPRLRGAGERHLVDDEKGAGVLLLQRIERLRIGHAVRHLAAAGE